MYGYYGLFMDFMNTMNTTTYVCMYTNGVASVVCNGIDRTLCMQIVKPLLYESGEVYVIMQMRGLAGHIIQGCMYTLWWGFC